MRRFKLRLVKVLLPACVILVSMSACSKSRLDLSGVKREEIDIKPLAYYEAPYHYGPLTPLKADRTGG